MVKKQHKFLCLVLCLALIATAVMVGAVSAFAASGDTVYVKANNGWTNLHCYMWNGNGEQKNADWPGVKMTEVGDGVYSYTLSGDFSKIIFNKGEGGNDNQTTDMDYPGANKIYDLKHTYKYRPHKSHSHNAHSHNAHSHNSFGRQCGLFQEHRQLERC